MKRKQQRLTLHRETVQELGRVAGARPAPPSLFTDCNLCETYTCYTCGVEYTCAFTACWGFCA